MQKLKPVQPVKKIRKKEKQLKVTINFNEVPELYKELIRIAKLNFRTPEEQILYCVWKQTNPEK